VAQRTAVRAIQAKFRLSERRACELVGLGRATCRYETRRAEWPALRERLHALAAERRRFGYRRLYILLRREGYRVNLKRVYRLYRDDGLAVRRRRRRRRVARGTPLAGPTRINERWSLDFLLDTLEDGRRVRLLAVVDDFTRACLAIEVDTSIGGRRVVEVLQRLVETRARPAVLITDNGPEFVGRALDAWAYAQGIRLHFIEPGKPNRMPTSRVSTAGSATSVSTSTGSSAWLTHARSSKPGAWTTMRFGLTALSATCPPRSSSSALLTGHLARFSLPDWTKVGEQVVSECFAGLGIINDISLKPFLQERTIGRLLKKQLNQIKSLSV
jgi:putative transposase